VHQYPAREEVTNTSELPHGDGGKNPCLAGRHRTYGGVFDERDTQAPCNEQWNQPLDQRRLAAAKPANPNTFMRVLPSTIIDDNARQD